MITVVLIWIVLLLCFYKFLKIYNYWSDQGVKHVSLFHCFKNFTVCIFRCTPSSDIIMEMYNKHKDERYVGFYQYFQPILLVRDPELIKQITVKHFDLFPDHIDITPSVDLNTLWSKNLFAMPSKAGWKQMRSILSPLFTNYKLSQMFSLMKECSTNCLKDLSQNKAKTSVLINDIAFRFANDVIASTAFGITCNSFQNKNNDFFKMTTNTINYNGLRGLVHVAYSLFPMITRKFNVQTSRTSSSTFFRNVFLESVRIRKENNIFRPDLINVLMNLGFQNDSLLIQQKSGINLTEDDFVGQTMLFLIAGVETIKHALSYIFYQLALNPQVQNQLSAELESTLQCNNGTMNYKALISMPYLNNVVKEGLRLHSPTTVLDRRCAQACTINAKLPHEKDIKLNVNDWVWIPHDAMHYDLKYYSNPEKFNPDRYDHEHNNNYTFLPFGIGPRNCIGSRFALLEIKLFLTEVLQHYEIQLCDNDNLCKKRYFGEPLWVQLYPKIKNV